MKAWPVLPLIVALMATNVAWAGVRCGSKLIDTGDFAAYVLQRCGEPESRQIISGATGADSPVVEQWVYDFGTSKPLKVLTFVGGRLQRIEDGPR